MFSDLQTALLSSPRERGGTIASSRLDYQKNWTICRILELHKSGAEYLVLCDYYEDFVLLDSETHPSLISFVQIKTKGTKEWTLNALLRRPTTKSGQLNSYLGKLYSCFLKIGPFTKELSFVSNAFFDLQLANKEASTERTHITCTELDQQQIEKINAKLTSEHTTICSLPNDTELHFEVSSLSLLDHSGHTKGKLVEFLDELRIRHAVSPVYRTLFDTIKKASSYEGSFDSFDDLKNHKGVSRSSIQRFLETLQRIPNRHKAWEGIREQLVSEGFPPMKIRHLHQIWTRWEVERMDATKDELSRLVDELNTKCQGILDETPDITLAQLETRIGSLVHNTIYDAEDIFVLSLMVIYEDTELS